MAKFYKKELVSNPFYFDNKAVPFEVNASTNQGVIRLDETKDAALIKELELAIEQRRGGIVAIDEEQYETIKKNTTGRLSAPFSQPARLRAMQPQGKPARSQNQAAAADENENPNPGKVQSSDPFPGDAPPLAPTTPFVPASAKAPAKSK